MEEALLKILVEAGTIGIVLALLIYMWKRDKLYNVTMNNHLDHDTKAKIKLAKAITKLSDNVRNCPYNKK